RVCVLGNTPWRAAVTQAVKGAIICPGRMLNRRMKTDVRDVYSWPNRHAERLDRTIEVLVVESIFIVPDAGTGIRHFVTHEQDTIVEVIGFDLVDRRTGPGRNRRMFSHSGSCGSKTKGLINSGYGVRTVRSVVIHVALVRMTLAPGAFVGHNVFRFGKIRRSRVQRGVQIVNVDQHSVRRYVMTVAGVIIRRGTVETSAEWIDPCARTDTGLTAVQTGAVCVRATGAKMGAAYTVASETAPVRRCRRKCVLTPGLADLFEPLVVTGPATHPVNILRNKWMVAVRQGKPIHVDRPFVTRISSQSEADAASNRTSLGLHKIKQTADD